RSSAMRCTSCCRGRAARATGGSPPCARRASPRRCCARSSRRSKMSSSPASAGPAMRDAVVVRALTRRFGEFTAVDAVSFEIAAGEIFGFRGPNGAGKTTTIRMLTALLRPTSGTAMVAGVDVLRDPPGVKRRIGYMSQKFSLYADLRVEENIAFFAGLYGVTGERLARRRDWILRTAGLETRRDAVTGTLPLGLRQRLALGCAVLHEPPILFL